MNETVNILFGLAGGLALFLFGMNTMSDALQKAAGDKMRKVLGFLTRNPLMGALAGALVTAVLQSSSATTVMVIGFVSSGLMTLPQGISVIFGANVGTTMTAQLLAFKISDYIYPIIFIGFILYFICKQEKVKNIGYAVFSFGVLFEGIEIMGSVMKPLANSPFFIDLMGQVSDIPVLGVGLGALMTLLVQSSSATIAVLQNFASQPGPDGISSIMGLAGAIPILFGDNIGTTITALIASIGQSKNAKRTAVAHSVFNITGSIVFLFLITPLAKFVQFISPKGPEVEVIARQIANAHTTFNLTCTIIWLPLIPIMVKIVKFIIRGEDGRALTLCDAQYLDERVIPQPSAAMVLVSKELKRVSEYASHMIGNVKDMMCGRETSDSRIKCDENKAAVLSLKEKIEKYIIKMYSSGNLTEMQAEQTSRMMFVANNLERIADRCDEVENQFTKMEKGKKDISQKATEEIGKYMDFIEHIFDESISAVIEGDSYLARRVSAEQLTFKKKHRDANIEHLERVKKKVCSNKNANSFTKILYSLDRIVDNCASIAEETMAGVPMKDLSDEALEGLEELQMDMPEAPGDKAEPKAEKTKNKKNKKKQ